MIKYKKIITQYLEIILSKYFVRKLRVAHAVDGGRFYFLCPSVSHPVGGIKVIYKHCELLNKSGVPASIVHFRKDFSVGWFMHQSDIIFKTGFDPNCDHLVIPEVMVGSYASQCLSLSIPYSIFVQNPFQINKGCDLGWLSSLYRGARSIISISNEATKIIHLLFPKLEVDRFVQVMPYVNLTASYSPSREKKKIISYMPRKIKKEVEAIVCILSGILPDEWALERIENKTELEAIDTISKSSIFLSFQDHEGYGLPALEAGLLGCAVIGYDGFGGKSHYWKYSSIYKRIDYSDMPSFIENIKRAMLMIEGGYLASSRFVCELESLRREYSLESQENLVLAAYRASSSSD